MNASELLEDRFRGLFAQISCGLSLENRQSPALNPQTRGLIMTAEALAAEESEE
jgi:hypothetical protein